MSFPTDTPNISDGSANHVYSAIKFGDWKVTRSEAAADPSTPAYLQISHTESGSGTSKKRRSLVRFDRTKEDSDGNLGVISAYLVVENPLGIAATADVTKTLTELVSWLAVSGYQAKLIAGEV